MQHLTSKMSLVSRSVCSHINKPPTFGLLVDIDGVIARGKNVIPGVPETIKKFLIGQGKFIIPTVFLTNSGNAASRDKAEQLSEWLNIEVAEEQVILAHGPLKTCKEYHNKNIFMSGQGNHERIAEELGFKQFVTIEDLRKVFPQLDVTDHERRKFKASPSVDKFSKIDVIVLIGEPVRWETALQLTIDLLLSDGDPSQPFRSPSYPHIPVLACNPDLQYMGEAHMPRFGHGAFLLCLESLYSKITSNELVYKYLVGKPSDVTFRFARQKILEQADNLNVATNIFRLYTIGDNVNTDIFGANLFNDIIKDEIKATKTTNNIESSHSVLVKTGVYNKNLEANELNHVHRNFIHLGKCYYKPNYIVKDLPEALELVFKLEGINK